MPSTAQDGVKQGLGTPALLLLRPHLLQEDVPGQGEARPAGEARPEVPRLKQQLLILAHGTFCAAFTTQNNHSILS